MSRFSDLASKTAASIERPKMAPPGVYELLVGAKPEPTTITTRDGGELEKLAVVLNGVGIVDVEDMQALEEAGGPGAVRVTKDFLIGDDEAAAGRTEYQMRLFFTEHLGLDSTLSMGELWEIAKGARCYAEIGHRQDPNDENLMYYQLKKTMPVS
jgi:hypothetical protein